MSGVNFDLYFFTPDIYKASEQKYVQLCPVYSTAHYTDRGTHPNWGTHPDQDTLKLDAYLDRGMIFKITAAYPDRGISQCR